MWNIFRQGRTINFRANSTLLCLLCSKHIVFAVVETRQFVLFVDFKATKTVLCEINIFPKAGFQVKLKCNLKQTWLKSSQTRAKQYQTKKIRSASLRTTCQPKFESAALCVYVSEYDVSKCSAFQTALRIWFFFSPLILRVCSKLKFCSCFCFWNLPRTV